jgi:fructose-specific phosphotransferase system IIC component
LLIHGIPSGNFAWSVGLFTVTAAYAVYIFSRYTVPARLRSKPAIFYLPLLTLGVAAVVDVGVFVRFLLQLGGGLGA